MMNISLMRKSGSNENFCTINALEIRIIILGDWKINA
jgi:hypothetical protein